MNNNTRTIIYTRDADNNIISETVEHIVETSEERQKVKDDLDDIFDILMKEANDVEKTLGFIKEKQSQQFCDFIEQLYPKAELHLDHNTKLISLLHFLTKVFEAAPKEERATLVDIIMENKLVSPKNCLMMTVVAQDHDMKYYLWEKGIKTEEQHYDVFYDHIGSRIYSYSKDEHTNQKDAFFKEQNTYILHFELERDLPNTAPKRSQRKI